MTRKMAAFRLLEWEAPPRLVEVDVPRPGVGDVLVRVAGCGLCHSDIAMRYMPKERGEAMGWRMPFTLGHEVGGTIEEVGPGAGGCRAGDQVVLAAPNSCGACWYCRRGHDNACVEGSFGRGYGRDGGLAAYVAAPARAVVRVPKLDPVEAAPLVDAGATAYHAVKRVLPKLAPGSTAVVIGAGGLGSFAIQFLRALSPARVVAVDLNPARLEFARELGAHAALTGVAPATTRDIIGLAGGDGADAILDFVGIDSTIEAGIGALRKTGTFALVGAGGGVLKRPWNLALPFEAEVFTFQGGTLSDTHEVVALAEGGMIRSEVEVFPLRDVGAAYERLDRGELRGRAVVRPDA